MGRLGIHHQDAPQFLRELRALRHLELEGIISHFASADELNEEGRSFTAGQSALFATVVDTARREGFTPRYLHLSNSAAAFSLELPFCNLVRPGIALYGAIPSADFAGKLDLQPVMSLKSRIAMLKWIEPGRSVSYARTFVSGRKTLVASVPVGYADGYCRALSNRGEALVRGRRAPVAGTVCMDWIMVDVTDIPQVAVGDEVLLLGADADGNCIRAEELAERAGTIPYEIFCGISKRVPRAYLNGSR
jgi:alanine racemase